MRVMTLVVDDHREFRRVAGEVVRATPGFESAGEAGSAAEAIAIARESLPDLALVDVHMPGVDGIELARRLKADLPGTVVALISAEDPDQLPPGVHTCGADHVLRKQDFGPAALRRVQPERDRMPGRPD